jgi:hypothetical protein
MHRSVSAEFYTLWEPYWRTVFLYVRMAILQGNLKDLLSLGAP